MQRIINIGLLIIVCVSAYFRFQGLGYDLPHAYNPDDLYTMDQAVGIGGMFHEAYITDKTPFFLIGRGINASLSVATIIVLFFLARYLLGESGALLSIAVFAVNLLDIQYAHEIYADTALMFTTTLMLFFLVRAHTRGNAVLLGLALVALGFALSTRMTALLFVPLYFLMALLVIRKSPLTHQKKISFQLILIVIAVAAVIFLTPVLIAQLHDFQTRKWLAPSDPYVDPLRIRTASYKEHVISYLLRLRDSVNTLPFIMAIVGIFVGLTKRVRFAPILCGFTLWYFLVVATTLPVWDILLLPILPIFSLFAGLGCLALYGFFTRALQMKAVSMMLVASLFVPATIKAFWLARSYTIPDTRTLEARWLTDHGVDESRVARDGFTSITQPPPNRLTSKLTRQQLLSFDYVVLSSWYSTHFSEPWRNTPELAGFYRDIKKSYKKVAVFSPNDTNVFIDDIELLTHLDAWQRLKYIRGPTLSVYSKPINE